MFSGSLVALTTPMFNDGQLDFSALGRLLEFQLSGGSDGIVVCGSTGEGAVLNLDERKQIIMATMEVIDQRLPVIAGVGTNSTKATIEQAREVADLGLDALLVICPYYNRPTQDGLHRHFEALATSVDIPIILYNHPGRTGVDLLPETAAKLAKLENIVGLKEAVVEPARFQALREHCPAEFALYSGDDPSCVEFIKAGAKGVISVAANVAPDKMQMIANAALHANWSLADDLQAGMSELYDFLGVESNPIPVKYLQAVMGLCEKGIRLPLTPLSAAYHAQAERFAAELLEQGEE